MSEVVYLMLVTFVLQDVSDTQDITTLRQMTGVCPQHNILFDDFTCIEHLRIFAGIKGVPDNQIEEEVCLIYVLLIYTCLQIEFFN